MILIAILKSKAAKELSGEELTKKLAEIKLELAKERGKIRVGGVPENPGKIREMRKTVARILTVLNSRTQAKGAVQKPQTSAAILRNKESSKAESASERK